jgi:16S rRNA (uracil1498-N3)-methyltransferase
MAERFFVDHPIAGDRAVLAGPEAHHLIHVMRAKPGTRVVLFDGSGAEFTAAVSDLRRSEVGLAVLDRKLVDRELPLRLLLAVALPKGDRQKWLIEKAVELGVSQVVPLETTRSVAQPVEQALERLRRTVIEASKQCGRNRLMELSPARTWEAFLQSTADVPARLLAHPESPSDQEHSSFILPPSSFPSVALAIGPEGGFSPDEVQTALAAGWRRIALGSRILRVETAAIFLVASVVQGF